ncbi:BAI1-associated protein 3 [Cichlidogyrus casuarinus]|uniref:BAI1-associated protein 3 n=1 Tax=Cichlidogyrus casuarinus TaxID=1844966 RepID=A0ABD2QFI5_9PLAT
MFKSDFFEEIVSHLSSHSDPASPVKAGNFRTPSLNTETQFELVNNSVSSRGKTQQMVISTLDTNSEYLQRIFELFEFFVHLQETMTSCLESRSEHLVKGEESVSGDVFVPAPNSTNRAEYSFNPVPGCSWSVVKVVHNIQWVIDAWIRLNWPERKTLLLFTSRVSNMLAETGMFYVESLQEKLRLSGYCDEQGQFDIARELCIALNNVDLIVSRLTSIPQAMRWSRLDSLVNFEKQQKKSPDMQQTKERISPGKMPFSFGPAQGSPKQSAAERSPLEQSLQSLYRLHAEQTTTIGNKITHIMQRALNDLFYYLENNLSTLRSELFQSNRKTFMRVVWNECMDEFRDQVYKELDESFRGGPGQLIPCNFFYQHPINEACLNETQHPGPLIEAATKAKTVLLRMHQAIHQVLQFFVKASSNELSKKELENHALFTVRHRFDVL